MLKKILITVLLSICTSTVALAHEGHDQTPGSLKSNHGGTVKPGKEINLEYVVSGSEVSFYPASHEGLDLPINSVKLSVTGKLPKGKSEILKIEPKKDYYITTVDFKKAYRIEIIATTEYNGKKDTFKFQVEK